MAFGLGREIVHRFRLLTPAIMSIADQYSMFLGAVNVHRLLLQRLLPRAHTIITGLNRVSRRR